MNVRTRQTAKPTAVRRSNRLFIAAAVSFLLFAAAASACTRQASTNPVATANPVFSATASLQPGAPTPSPTTAASTTNTSTSTTDIGADQIAVSSVEVTPKAGIRITGESRLPENACVKTELMIGNDAVEWWPRDICIQPDNGKWEMVVPLGRQGSPEALDNNVQYQVRAWWPSQPETTLTIFPFDITPPPAGSGQ